MTEEPASEHDRTDTGKRGGMAGDIGDVVPKPRRVTPEDDEYRITEHTEIAVDDRDARPIATFLADVLRPSTGYDLPIVAMDDPDDGIVLRLSGAPESVGAEGYELTANEGGVTIRAAAPAGLFAGVQTLRQLLPPAVESDAPAEVTWTVPGGQLLDYPRFPYRGCHFDVARHFFDVDEVKRFVDHLSLYKLNHLHLHLTDDQGWRIEIESWPKLTEVGARTQIGGGEGGYFTQAEYEEIVSYAADRFVTVVPEIDVPGHTHAAYVSYDELNPDDEPAEPFTEMGVGFSTLPIDEEVTYEFLDDVFREVAAITPGPFLHVGGDEAHELSDEEYERFVDRAVPLVETHGKRPMGWYQILAGDVPSSTVGQFWSTSPDSGDIDVEAAAEEGIEFVLSPVNHTYLDLKYDEDTVLGNDWAGPVSIDDAYDWDPGTYADGIGESSVLGVEAAVWTETMETFADVEFMVFPRLPAIAERGWTPTAECDLADFKRRLAGHAPRWDRLGVDFYRSPAVDWPDVETT